ncbi:hypothetical protein Csa_003974, partial [Cucumis sativus]
ANLRQSSKLSPYIIYIHRSSFLFDIDVQAKAPFISLSVQHLIPNSPSSSTSPNICLSLIPVR